jgi:CRISPR-associated protein Cas1
MIGGVVCFSRPGASPALMADCAEAGIALSFLTPNGRFLARMEGPRTGNVLLRRTQYRMADDPVRTVPVVRGIVTAKAANQRTVLRRALRDHGGKMNDAARSAVETAEMRLGHIAQRAAAAGDIAILRGHEGDAAMTYFRAFDAMIQGDRAAFRFHGRSRRPRSTGSMPCCPFSMRCWGMIAVRLWKASASIRRSVSCMPTGRAGRVWRWI